MERLRVRVDGDVGTILLSDPARFNAITHRLLDELADVLDAFAEARIQAAVLRAEPGAGIWSAGRDAADPPRRLAQQRRHPDPVERALEIVAGQSIPLIAMISGSAGGGASDLALACDLRVADASATFAVEPSQTGLLRLIARAGTDGARSLVFAAAPVDAREAHRHGLVDHVVAATELERFTYEIAARIAAQGRFAVSEMAQRFHVVTAPRPRRAAGPAFPGRARRDAAAPAPAARAARPAGLLELPPVRRSRFAGALRA